MRIFGTLLDKYLDKIQSVNNKVEFRQHNPRRWDWKTLPKRR